MPPVPTAQFRALLPLAGIRLEANIRPRHRRQYPEAGRKRLERSGFEPGKSVIALKPNDVFEVSDWLAGSTEPAFRAGFLRKAALRGEKDPFAVRVSSAAPYRPAERYFLTISTAPRCR